MKYLVGSEIFVSKNLIGITLKVFLCTLGLGFKNVFFLFKKNEAKNFLGAKMM